MERARQGGVSGVQTRPVVPTSMDIGDFEGSTRPVSRPNPSHEVGVVE